MQEVALVVLSLIFVIQLITTKTRFDIRRSGFFGILISAFAIIIFFSFAVYQSWNLYSFWLNDLVGKFLLPPYRDFDYFVFNARTRFFNPYLLSLIMGLIFLGCAKYFNKKYGERFFEPIGPYLFGIAIFLTGYPGWLFYLALLLIIYFLFCLVALARINTDKNADQRGKDIGVNQRINLRISAYYLWLPTALFTIIISKWLSVLPLWQTLTL